MAVRSFLPGTLLLVAAGIPLAFVLSDEPAAPEAAPVSYYKQIRPIFQANCQGCHQPAKASGAYVMTDFARLLAGGETGDAAVVAGKPDESPLIKQITPENGMAAMPKDKAPLSQTDIDLIRKWIEQGAKDDTPANAVQRYDVDHPPVYSRLPVITALDYSPDGQLLAVAGFHEVLLHKADGNGLAARLIGLSERIESVRFSPDGKRLAVTGGLPCRVGELQIWDVEKRELTLSVPITFDTAYGASWSPDGALVAIGCADKTVRAFKSDTGEQVFFNGAHDDWALDTVFSQDGSLLISVGRDMSTKLYDVKTQRFIDNVTSITPGALKGGISSVARNPQRDEVLVGGSDGAPRIYRMQRVTNRVIGDDANLMRRYPQMRGRIFSVDYTADGKKIVAASSLDGKGQVWTFGCDFDFTMPEDIKNIVQKVSTSQSAEEQKRLEEYVTTGVAAVTQTEVPASVYSVAFSPDGNTIAAAGADGMIRFINAADGVIAREFAAIEVNPDAPRPAGAVAQGPAQTEEYFGEESLPSGVTVVELAVEPQEVDLSGSFAYAQVLVTGVLNTGDRVDVTRLAELKLDGDAALVTKGGRIKARGDGDAKLNVQFGSLTAAIPVHVSGVADPAKVSFIRDVNPVLSRVGCNAGTCHGSKEGKNGFKLSLRGYDPILDVRAFTDDLASRRTNVASPDDSLMLLKATGAVPHVGGQLMKPGQPYYEIIRGWIAQGVELDLSVPRVTQIAIEPQNPVIQQLGGKQQIRVAATYSDGSSRDVTGEAYIESGNTEVAEINRHGIATTLRRGEAPVLARFEGSYAATTITSMGDRTGFVWQEPETWGEIDRFVAAKWDRMKIQPSELCPDDEFIRRAYIDLTGLPPSADDVRAFLADSRDTRTRRDEVIGKLIGSEAYIEFWTNKWADLLQDNSKFLGGEGAKELRAWIRGEVAANTPYDQFCYKILSATGSNKENPPVSYFKTLRTPDAIMENTTQLFLAVRFNCNKCHDHPFERWTQNQYYETAAFFARVDLQRDPKNAEGNIGGTAVEGAKPQWEVIVDKQEGEVTHLRTGAVTQPVPPYDRDISMPGDATRREQIARWITSPENDYFARSYVNRVWGYLLGKGLIEPLDDIRAGNPPTNPDLLNWLTAKFIESGFDVRQLMHTICTSRTYQLSIASNKWNEDDTRNYSHATPKRLSSETLYDAIYTVTGSKMRIPGVPEGTRAAAIADAAVGLPDGFLANLGRPARESACECERSSDMQLGAVMAMMNGPTVSEAISQPDNAIAQLVAQQPDNARLVDELFLRILNRAATPVEIQATIDSMGTLPAEHEGLVADLAAYEQQIAPVIAEKEQKRQALIAAAKQAHDAYQEEIRPREEQAEKERQEKIAATEKDLAEYEAALPAKLVEWEKAAASAETAWVMIDPRDMTASTKAKLERQDDLSIFASGPNNRKGNYTITAETDLKGITGVKLELLADSRLPANGPGRADNGNLVLSEFTVNAWPKGQPDAKAKVELQNAKADYSQGSYDVATAIDGQAPGANNGWAIAEQFGKNHVATFECKQPIAGEATTVLQFVLDHQFQDNKHTIGRFRISVTTAPAPLHFGLPENILQIVQTAADGRSDEQKQALLDYFKSIDDELKTKQKAVADAKQPRPEDPRLVELRQKLDEANKPLPEDPHLVRLQRAVKLSEEQLQNSRLTTAQDLAWALINSPAFLFNR